MGTYLTITESTVAIPSDRQNAALTALQTAGRAAIPAPGTHAAWEAFSLPDALLAVTTLDDFLSQWGFETLDDDENRDLHIIGYIDGEQKDRLADQLWALLAPFIPDGRYVDYAANDEHWRHSFAGGFPTTTDGQVIYDTQPWDDHDNRRDAYYAGASAFADYLIEHGNLDGEDTRSALDTFLAATPTTIPTVTPTAPATTTALSDDER